MATKANDADEPLKCHFCDATAGSVDDAITMEWEPSFFDGQKYGGGPVCGECSEKYLRPGDDGKMELIPPRATFE